MPGCRNLTPALGLSLSQTPVQSYNSSYDSLHQNYIQRMPTNITTKKETSLQNSSTNKNQYLKLAYPVTCTRPCRTACQIQIRVVKKEQSGGRTAGNKKIVQKRTRNKLRTQQVMANGNASKEKKLLTKKKINKSLSLLKLYHHQGKTYHHY